MADDLSLRIFISQTTKMVAMRFAQQPISVAKENQENNPKKDSNCIDSNLWCSINRNYHIVHEGSPLVQCHFHHFCQLFSSIQKAVLPFRFKWLPSAPQPRHCNDHSMKQLRWELIYLIKSKKTRAQFQGNCWQQQLEKSKAGNRNKTICKTESCSDRIELQRVISHRECQ